ncbi:hypothetical protein [Rhizobium sp. 007]|uniref:hypothetical protein n=1 Tax=Rhizobium sp. 007 TaxID=2785056 RepID=UPI001FEE63FF|nr:hypothetical protein [Rhizobium sp. 007]
MKHGGHYDAQENFEDSDQETRAEIEEPASRSGELGLVPLQQDQTIPLQFLPCRRHLLSEQRQAGNPFGQVGNSVTAGRAQPRFGDTQMVGNGGTEIDQRQDGDGRGDCAEHHRRQATPAVQQGNHSIEQPRCGCRKDHRIGQDADKRKQHPESRGY